MTSTTGITQMLQERYRLAAERPEAWISLRPLAEVAQEMATVDPSLPLAGTVFAVKNNIDVAGLETTAACPAYAYRPSVDATAVARLRAAGAVIMGTTNLDQFATGLVGTRSPYGAVRHAERPDHISGGSSSGSAVAVALGAVDFALGTDTAGSGRVPAALHGIWGIKPTKGWGSCAGVVPACRSLDVVTVFDTDPGRAWLATQLMSGFDENDLLSRQAQPATLGSTIAVADPSQIGELAPGWLEAYQATIGRAEAMGYHTRVIDIEPLLALARLLYEGAFVAERYAAVGRFVDAHPDEVDPVVGPIIGSSRDIPAWRVFDDIQRRQKLIRDARREWDVSESLLLPTTTQHPTLAAVQQEPIAVNSDLGRFTNFVNQADLAAIAFPGGRAGLDHVGMQIIGPAFSDQALLQIAQDVATSDTEKMSVS